jgi:hypothetical protein
VSETSANLYRTIQLTSKKAAPLKSKLCHETTDCVTKAVIDVLIRTALLLAVLLNVCR